MTNTDHSAVSGAEDRVVVEQVDRDAAATLYEWFPAMSSTRDAALKTAQFIRDGGGDGWNTVHLMRDHRLAALARNPAPAIPVSGAETSVVVSQSDREAAARLLLAIDYVAASGAEWVRAGHVDIGPTVQAFARHRPQAASADVREAAERAQEIVKTWYDGTDADVSNKSLKVLRAAITSALATPDSAPIYLPAEVRALVIAGREFWDENNDTSPESAAMFNALEAFSERVPYEDEPDDAAAPIPTPAPVVGAVEAAWDQRYRRLDIGEIIAPTDECQRDDGSWIAAVCVGEPAPDPNYSSHRVYRRMFEAATVAKSVTVQIPAGMVPWHGGEHAPDDWDGGPVLWREGTIGVDARWFHATEQDHREGRWLKDFDIIAYTPAALSAAVLKEEG